MCFIVDTVSALRVQRVAEGALWHGDKIKSYTEILGFEQF